MLTLSCTGTAFFFVFVLAHQQVYCALVSLLLTEHYFSWHKKWGEGEGRRSSCDSQEVIKERETSAENRR